MPIDIDYKTRNDLVKNSLIIITPALKLTDFILHSGDIWKKTTTRRPEKITRNGQQMTLVSSIVDVDADSKYYYSSGVVYVYIPSTDYFTLFFNLYYGDRGFKLPKDLDLEGSAEITYFEPRIKGNPSFIKPNKEKMQGVSITGEASFTIIDVENEYFEKITDILENKSYSFIDKDVKIYRFLSEESPQLIQKLFRGKIIDWAFDGKHIAFRAKDFIKKFESSVQSIEYNTTLFPNCNPYYIGKVQRTIYGKNMIKAVNVDYVNENPTETDNRIWNLSHHINKSVDEVWLKGLKLTETTHYTVNGNKNQITLVDNLETALSIDVISGDEDIFVYVQGKVDGSNNLITSASDIVKDVLGEIGFDLVNDIDVASFNQAKIDNTYEIAFALPQSVDAERPNAREVIENINKSVLGFLSMDNNFKIRFDIYQEKTADINLSKDYDLIDRSINSEVDEMASQIIINYAFSERNNLYLTKSISDNDAKYLHENLKSNTIDSVLLNESEALDLATDYNNYYKHPSIFENFSLKLQIDNKIIGDFVNVENKKCELLKMDKSINNISVSARRV